MLSLIYSKLSLFLYILLSSFLLSGCAAVKQKGTINTLQATDLNPVGRYALQEGELQLVSSGVHFGFTFEGTVCTLYVASPGQHNYLQYELDGVYAQRLRIDNKTIQPLIITAPNSGKHTILIYKATEAHTGPVHIQQVAASNIKALPQPKKTIIEFIGNSITCGAAADPSDVPCGKGSYHDQHNAYMAYGPRVARSLGTEFVLSSVSGIGIYRNWNSDGPAMPQVYQNTHFQTGDGNPWNFKLFTPQVVSIALGTNDFSNGDGKQPRKPFDSAAFVSNYIHFVNIVKSKYPRAQIVLLSSPMVHGDKNKLLQNCITAVKESIDATHPTDKKVAIYFFKPMQAQGCTGHPSVEDHAVLAKELEPFFKNLLD